MNGTTWLDKYDAARRALDELRLSPESANTTRAKRTRKQART